MVPKKRTLGGSDVGNGTLDQRKILKPINEIHLMEEVEDASQQGTEDPSVLKRPREPSGKSANQKLNPKEVENASPTTWDGLGFLAWLSCSQLVLDNEDDTTRKLLDAGVNSSTERGVGLRRALKDGIS